MSTTLMPIDLELADYRMRQAVRPLIEQQKYASAIRDIFALLATRVRKHCNIPDGVDGVDLVNRIFGKTSTLLLGLPETERQSYRDLFAGTYGAFRNKFMHNDATPGYVEMIAVLGACPGNASSLSTRRDPG